MSLEKYTVVATGKMRQCAYEYLKKKVNLIDWQQGGKIPATQLTERLQLADAIYSTGNIKIDEEFLSKAPNVKVIAQASVGYDNIDVNACYKREILVGNTPGVLVDAVADLAYGLLLDSARRIVQADKHVKEGLWGARKPFGLTNDLAYKTLGIVGMGDIGSAVAKRAQVSKMNVIYYNRHRRLDDEKIGALYTDFSKLVAESDYILLAVTLNDTTKNLFNKDIFSAMKKGASLINISRGAVVDTEALYHALADGHLAYAALDVTEPEPLPENHKLLALPNITITPHIASATKETRDAMAMLTVENILAGLLRQPLPAQVKIR